MRTIMILVFVLIGMIGHAQVKVSIDSVQVGDDLVFEKTSNWIYDSFNGCDWRIPSSSLKVCYISNYNDGFDFMQVVDNSGKFYYLDIADIKKQEKKKRVHVCH